MLLLCLIHHQTDLLAKISSLTSMHFYPVEVASQKVLWSGDIHVVHKTEARVVLIVLCLSTLSRKGVTKISPAVKPFFRGLITM